MCEYPFTIDSQEIVATSRKLKAVWSHESQQDLRQFHNIDAEAELVKTLTKELQAEIDREILEDLKSVVQKGQETERKVISGKIKKKKVKVTWGSLFDD
jgi:predicted phage-related endonuclease